LGGVLRVNTHLIIVIANNIHESHVLHDGGDERVQGRGGSLLLGDGF
jgi:hypothetical protein